MVIWSSGVFFSSLRFLLLWFITRPRSVLCAPSFIRNRVNLLGNDFGEKKTNILSIDRRIMRSWLVREGGGQKKKKEKEKKKQKKKRTSFHGRASKNVGRITSDRETGPIFYVLETASADWSPANQWSLRKNGSVENGGRTWTERNFEPKNRQSKNKKNGC